MAPPPPASLQSVVERAVPAAPGTTTRVTNQNGRDSELEIAVADGGKAIVIGSNNGFFFSADGGDSWAASAGVGSNDPSVTWGPSGGAAGRSMPPTSSRRPPGSGPRPTAARASPPAPTPTPAARAATPPAARRFPTRSTSPPIRFNQTAGGDRSTTCGGISKATGGSSARRTAAPPGAPTAQFFAGDLPKVSVSPIGLVYVAYHPTNDDNIQVRIFDSCENGLNDQFGAVLVIADPGGVACPTPGLDRCNERNSLASPIVAVDDTDISHVYIGYAANLVPGNGGGWYGNCAEPEPLRRPHRGAGLDRLRPDLAGLGGGELRPGRPAVHALDLRAGRRRARGRGTTAPQRSPAGPPSPTTA